MQDGQLLAHGPRPLRAGGPDASARLYQDDVERPGSSAVWIRTTLQAHGKTIIKSEGSRFR